MISTLTVVEIRRRLGVGDDDAQNIHRLLTIAESRGEAGRWPRQDFEHAEDWTDGPVLDRVAIIADLDTAELFELYQQAHARGLATWRATIN